MNIKLDNKEQIVSQLLGEVRNLLLEEGVAMMILDNDIQSGLLDTEGTTITDSSNKAMKVLLERGQVIVSSEYESIKLSRILNTLNIDYLSLNYEEEDNLFLLQEDIPSIE